MQRRDALKWLGLAPWASSWALWGGLPTPTSAAGPELLLAAAESPAAPTRTDPVRTIEIEIDPVDEEAAVPTCVAISPNGQLVAAGADDHRVRLWNLSDGTLLTQLREHVDWVRAVAFHPSGKKLLTGGDDHAVLIWDLETHAVLHRIKVPEGVVHCAAFRPDGKQAAAGCFDDKVRIIDVETGEVKHELKASASDVRALAFAPNNQMLAAAGRDGVIRIWNLSDYSLRLDIPAHRMRIRALAFSPDGGQLASAGDDRKYFLWSIDGTRDATLGHPNGRIFSLAFLGPDHLASGGSDNVIRVLDVRSRRELAQLVGHSGSVAALDYNPDGGLLASGGFDTTVRLWKPLAGHGPAATERTTKRLTPPAR
jgi:WD40 repeat protein